MNKMRRYPTSPLIKNITVDSVTFEKHFIAIRHESEILTPLIESPIINFSLREMAYLGAFGLSVIFAAVGSVPILFAALASPLFGLAFLKVHGEIPEMYLYYMLISLLEPSRKKTKNKKKKTKRKKRQRRISTVSGFGERFGVDDYKTSKPASDAIQRIPFIDEHTPIEMTLEIGNNHRYSTVTILVDEQKILRDTTNGAGQIKITIMPQEGRKRFSVRDKDATTTIISKTVELYHEK